MEMLQDLQTDLSQAALAASVSMPSVLLHCIPHMMSGPVWSQGLSSKMSVQCCPGDAPHCCCPLVLLCMDCYSHSFSYWAV